MWQYRVTTLPAWRISTYQPQPRTSGPPSTSHEGPDVLHTTVMTVPSAVALIGVLRACMMSMPSWSGREAVRKPLLPRPGTGATHVPMATAPVGGMIFTTGLVGPGAGGGGQMAGV